MAHILLVDDSGLILHSLGEMLRPLGHMLDFAMHSGEAKDLLAGSVLPDHETPFDLIVCDNNMRVENEGIGFAEELWLTNNTIPFILYTSSPMREFPSNWKKWGIHYVSKLSLPAVLIEKIDELTTRA